MQKSNLVLPMAAAWVIITCEPKVTTAGTEEVQIAALDGVTAEDLQPHKEQVAQNETSVSANIFGAKSGYVHPFVSLSTYYTDNVYVSKNNQQTDWVRSISPGVWLAFPGRNQVLLTIPSSNTQPAGLELFLDRPESFSRFQGYAFYGADLEYFQDNDDRDNTKQSGEVFLQYNLRGGLSLNAYDRWVDSEEWRWTSNISSDISSYVSNLAGLVADYEMSEKVSIRLDYNNFDLDYDEDIDFDKNRTDNGGSLYGFYHYSPKTSLFIEYRYTNVSYESDELLNSDQNALYGGVKWSPTVSTKLIGKLGGVHKNFESEEIEAVDKLGAEVQAVHAFSEMSNINLLAAQKINETDVSSTTYQIKTSFSGQYSHNFTTKITGVLGISYNIHDYKSTSESNEREDNTHIFSTGVKYRFNDWLMAAATYYYNNRESTDNGFDYDENRYMLKLSGVL